MTNYFAPPEALDEGVPIVDVLLLYEDFSMGLRSKQALDHVVSHLEPTISTLSRSSTCCVSQD
jgi:hypothetical protein